MLSTGSEQQGQNIRVRTVFLTLTKILDLLVIFHQICKNITVYLPNHDCYIGRGKCLHVLFTEQIMCIFPDKQLVGNHMSCVVRKPAFCICENKDADQLRGNRKADLRLCFRYINCAIPSLPKYEISSL